MAFYKRVGAVFASFCALMLVWNLLTPSNEDHWINVAEHTILSIGFSVSIFCKFTISRWLQVGMLFLGSWMTAIAGDIPPSATVATVGVVMAYTYGKFQPFPQWLMLFVSLMQLGVTFTSSILQGQSTVVAAGRTIVWALLPLMGVWLFWSILHQFAEKMIAQNRELLEINKTLLKGGQNGSDRT